MMFASLNFWLCILTGTYIGITYLIMYTSFNDAQLEEVGCCYNCGIVSARCGHLGRLPSLHTWPISLTYRPIIIQVLLCLTLLFG